VRTSRWQLVSRGLHAPATPCRPLAEECRLTAAVLPVDAGFGHLTGVRLRGWWLPLLLEEHVLLASTRTGVHVQRRGVYVRRSAYADVELVEGVPLVTAAETLVELARDLSLLDLVPMVDRAMAAGVTRQEVLAVCRPRTAGVPVLRAALDLADPRSESWWESVLRVLHVVTGLGPVDSQVEVTSPSGLRMRADLHLVGTNRYPECDGGEHRTPDRHARDLERDKAFLAMGLERFGYPTAQIARRPETVILDGERARGLPHDPRRAARWRSLAHPSSLTAYGRTRLSARLRRYCLAANRRLAR
jgi:hypothetical protein